MSKDKLKVIAKNRQARFRYEILDTYEAGIALCGTEVKALRQGNANLAEAYAIIRHEEIFIRSLHISPYEQGNRFNHEPLRERKLLLHKSEIYRLKARVEEDGLTLVPLSMYFKDGLVKVELALARGKKLYDKRESLKKREVERRIKENYG